MEKLDRLVRKISEDTIHPCLDEKQAMQIRQRYDSYWQGVAAHGIGVHT